MTEREIERERLVELLDIIIQPGEKTLGDIADYLIANNVLVLPCKVGDTIYRCGDPIKKVYEWKIEHIELYVDEIVFVDDSDNEFTVEDIGKTVFLTKEEVVKAPHKINHNSLCETETYKLAGHE